MCSLLYVSYVRICRSSLLFDNLAAGDSIYLNIGHRTHALLNADNVVNINSCG